ncbi:Cytochrome P450 [Penicillium crustosum]|uniref:Cytochrome P450 n=1 Tax=Penicillium crustosum TaxID=36656 RepID=UPI0023A55663|nr:Cytochrome P450 [Penicillium crustosum]KAJ5393899.1 Cytochrome P450 [Penicillium crustosum]
MLHPKRYSNIITKLLIFGICAKIVCEEYMKCRHPACPLVCSAALYTPMAAKQLAEPGRRSGCGRSRSAINSVFSATLPRIGFCIHQNRPQFRGFVLIKGGSDTLSSLILTIIQAMSEYPEVQAKCADRVFHPNLVNHDRSPAWCEWPKVAYINMIIKESHRWHDRIDGKLTPQGSSIVLNV